MTIPDIQAVALAETVLRHPDAHGQVDLVILANHVLRMARRIEELDALRERVIHHLDRQNEALQEVIDSP